MKKPNGYWTYENTLNEAKKYKYKAEFCKNNVGAFNAAYRNNWIKDYTWFEDGKKIRANRDRKWTKEECYKLALKCVSRSDFQKHSSRAYTVARKNGWLDEYVWFKSGFDLYHENSIKWTYENTKEESKKYTSRQEFCDNCIGGYEKALKQGWLDDFTWLKPKLIKEARSQGNVYWVYGYFDFGNKVCYIGLSRDKARHWRHTQKDKSGKYDSVMSYFNDIYGFLPDPTIIEENLIAEEAQNKEAYYVQYFKDKSYTLLNIAKTGSLGSAIVKWTEEACFEEAKKYKTRGEFSRKSGSAYHSALKNNWLDNYTWFISKDNRDHPVGYWTKERCLEEAKKYKSREEFNRNSRGAYRASNKNKWLDEFFPKTK